MNSAEILFIFSPSFVLFPRCCMRRVHLYQRSHRCWCNSLWSDQRAFICPKKTRYTSLKKAEKWRKRSILLGQTFPSDMFNNTTKINQLLKKYTDRYVMCVCIILNLLLCKVFIFAILPPVYWCLQSYLSSYEPPARCQRGNRWNMKSYFLDKPRYFKTFHNSNN